MDPLPLIPEVLGNQNAASVLREEFQDTIDGLSFPKDIAENIIRYNVDTELKSKHNACKVVEVNFIPYVNNII
ncbi:hypothetical protein NQ314_005936 [Rhamnusium bicolor]|uniref:Uncharacterized protein n=1 Tax=Rhamnusium bicolor TaxID=1586634 RepID=A0AAV8ZB38_9CUCU|nr:hypothetical protein NQ314_005936 [Rhamnusium bicolor]